MHLLYGGTKIRANLSETLCGLIPSCTFPYIITRYSIDFTVFIIYLFKCPLKLKVLNVNSKKTHSLVMHVFITISLCETRFFDFNECIRSSTIRMLWRRFEIQIFFYCLWKWLKSLCTIERSHSFSTICLLDYENYL